MDIIRQIIALLIPWKNETAAQKVGTVLTIIALLASFAATFFPAVPPTPAPVPSPDVIVPLDVPAADPGAVPGSDVPGDESASVGILGTIAAGISAPFGCSANQVRQMRIAGTDALACLTQCGASEAVTTIKDWGDDGSVKLMWKDATNDMINCATPCLWGLGVATFNTYALSAGYFGSASEPVVFNGTMTEIVVSPRKAK